MWQGDGDRSAKGPLILQYFTGDSRDSPESTIYILVEIRYNVLYLTKRQWFLTEFSITTKPTLKNQFLYLDLIRLAS